MADGRAGEGPPVDSVPSPNLYSCGRYFGKFVRVLARLPHAAAGQVSTTVTAARCCSRWAWRVGRARPSHPRVSRALTSASRSSFAGLFALVTLLALSQLFRIQKVDPEKRPTPQKLFHVLIILVNAGAPRAVRDAVPPCSSNGLDWCSQCASSWCRCPCRCSRA
jgi:hypothetical protein